MSSQRLLPFLAVLLAGCAAQLPAPPSAQTVSSVRPAAAPNASPEAVKTKAGDYALSQEEQSLDCRKLTGRIHIRIAHMRDAAKRGNVSLLSRGLQTVVTPVFGVAVPSLPLVYGLSLTAQFVVVFAGNNDKGMVYLVSYHLGRCALYWAIGFLAHLAVPPLGAP